MCGDGCAIVAVYNSLSLCMLCYSHYRMLPMLVVFQQHVTCYKSLVMLCLFLCWVFWSTILQR